MNQSGWCGQQCCHAFLGGFTLVNLSGNGPSVSAPVEKGMQGFTMDTASASFCIHLKSHSKIAVTTSHLSFFLHLSSFLHLPLQIALRYCLCDVSQHKPRWDYMALLKPFWRLIALVGVPYDSSCSSKKSPSVPAPVSLLWSIFGNERQSQILCFPTEKQQYLWCWVSSALTTIISTRSAAHRLSHLFVLQ